jgi:chemotaxis protein methyltransferase CheR
MKYFRRDGTHWKVVPELAAQVTFSKLNLIDAWPPMPSFDVVFLRNVLIYFAPETKRKILENVHRRMAPRGVLFLGAAETTMGLDVKFEREQAEFGAYYRAI